MPLPDLAYYANKANREIKGGFAPEELIELANQWNFEVSTQENVELLERFGRMQGDEQRTIYPYSAIETYTTKGTTDVAGNGGTTVVDSSANFTQEDQDNFRTRAFPSYYYHNTDAGSRSRIADVVDNNTLTLEDSGVAVNNGNYTITYPGDPQIPTVRIVNSFRIHETDFEPVRWWYGSPRRFPFRDGSRFDQGIKGQHGIPFYTRLDTVEFFEDLGDRKVDVIYQKNPMMITSLSGEGSETDLRPDDYYSLEFFIKMVQEEGIYGASPQWRPAWEEFKAAFAENSRRRLKGNDPGSHHRP